jgi:hypothetical protein
VGNVIANVPAKTLKKIEDDIKNDNVGKARDRLHGLIHSYPDDLELRKKLGDIYYALKFPTMAGRYWYLERNKTPEMINACLQFEKSCGNDPFHISNHIKFKGNRDIIKNLQLEQVISPAQSKVKEKLEDEYEESLADRLVPYGCVFVIILFIALSLIGVYTVFNWIF